MQPIKKLGVILLTVFLFSCQTAKEPVITSDPAEPLKKSISKTNEMVAEILALSTTNQLAAKVPKNSILYRDMTFVISGDIELAVKRFADLLKVKYLISGVPKTKLLVFVSENTTALRALTQMSAQIGNGADLVWDENNQSLELKYH